MTRVGTLGRRRGATVDQYGVVTPDDLGWTLDWRIGADDRWRTPQRETAVRQSLLDGAPVVRTAMRVPGGDAVSEVYGVADGGGLVVVEITNDSPAPFAVALVVREARSVAIVDSTIVVDRRPGLLLPRVPSRWATAVGASTDIEVCGGTAREGAFPGVRSRAGRAEAAFLLPVPHRVSMRAAIGSGALPAPVELSALPTAADAARGWRAQLGRGMRVDAPDPRLTAAVEAALAQVLLAAQGSRPTGETFRALEDWGFDVEAAETWRSVPGRERRRARARPPRPAQANELDALLEAASSPAGLGAVAPHLLLCLRSLLAWESAEGEVIILAELPAEWRGQPLDVHEAPTRSGPVSYAVRWHGPRPALLWSAPPGVRVCAPGLDPEWWSEEPSGEALLQGSVA